MPGLYSLSPYSLDEQVAREFLTKTPPDALINIVDSTNLERSLYLTLQLMELGIPMVLALNMSDLLAGQGKKIDIEKLSYSLGIPVVTTSAIKNKGLDEVVKVALKSHESQTLDYDHRLEGALSEIGKVTGFTNRFEQIKVFEGDKLLLAGETDKALSQQVHTDNSQAGLSAKQLAEIEEIVSITEKLMADDRESIIVNERYDLIGHIVQLCVTQTETGKINLTDRIDQIITHKWLGLPIFVFIMWLVYFISIQTVGTAATDWLNDVFFGQWLPDLIANGMNAVAVTPCLLYTSPSPRD